MKQPAPSLALVDLSERLDNLERTFRSIEFEWNEMHEKFSTLHARLSKRMKKQEEQGGGGEAQQVPEGASYAQRLAAARARYGGMRVG